MPSCVFKHCKNYGSKVNKAHGITYHMFPTNMVSLQKWIAVVRTQRNEFDWRPSSSSKICSNHFNATDTYISNKGRLLLRKSAVPFIEGQTNSQITPIQLEISDITEDDAELDAYDRFALSIAKKIKSIHAIAGRIRLMNAVQDLVDNFCSTNPHEPNDSATQLIMHVPMVDGSVMAQGVIVERQVRESKEETVNSEQVMQPSASIVDQPVHVQQITIDPKPSVEKKPRRTPAKRRKVAELPKMSASKEQHNSQVPAETTLPTEFVSLGLKHEAQLGHNDGEPKPHIDILEIKQEKVQEEETATESTATTSSAPARASIPGITFINDPIPIKVEVIDMEEF